MRMPATFKRDRTFEQPIEWVTTLFMVLFHAGAVVALFVFSWKALALAILLWWITGSLGIGMGYHRLLTHRGYKTPKWVEFVLTVCGTLALEGGPIPWVATHRVHYQNTDKEGDPHSPAMAVFGRIPAGSSQERHCITSRKSSCLMFPICAKAISMCGSANGTGSLSLYWGLSYLL